MCRSNKTIPRALAMLVLTVGIASTGLAAFRQGERLPDLASFKLEGKLPEQLKGKVILLDFWASWCAPCKASFPAMEELNRKYSERGLTIIAVSVDEKRENMERFLKSQKVSFSIVRDANHKLVEAADVSTMPTSFVIDRSGKIRFLHSGFRGEETARQYAEEIEQLLKEPKP